MFSVTLHFHTYSQPRLGCSASLSISHSFQFPLFCYFQLIISYSFSYLCHMFTEPYFAVFFFTILYVEHLTILTPSLIANLQFSIISTAVFLHLCTWYMFCAMLTLPLPSILYICGFIFFLSCTLPPFFCLLSSLQSLLDTPYVLCNAILCYFRLPYTLFDVCSF